MKWYKITWRYSKCGLDLKHPPKAHRRIGPQCSRFGGRAFGKQLDWGLWPHHWVRQVVVNLRPMCNCWLFVSLKALWDSSSLMEHSFTGQFLSLSFTFSLFLSFLASLPALSSPQCCSTGSSDHRQKTFKLGAKINLFSFNFLLYFA